MKKGSRLQLLVSLFAFGVIQSSCISGDEKEIVVQAHRGGSALYPENTVPAMIHAAGIGIRTLELDLQVTKDSQVVVSHDAFLNSAKALFPGGERISKEQEDSLLIFRMDYDSLCKFDVGSLANPVYPRRKNLRCVIPTLTDLIDCVETYVYSKGIAPVSYNIEIKSSPENDGRRTPDYKTYCDLSMKVLLEKNLTDRLCIQSFDARSLNYIHHAYPQIQLSYLVEESGRSVSGYLEELGFVPEVISPLHSIVTQEFVTDAHERNLKVIPWTVDTEEEVLRLKALGVDEIITNEPDSVQLWLYKAGRKGKHEQGVSEIDKLVGD